MPSVWFLPKTKNPKKTSKTNKNQYYTAMTNTRQLLHDQRFRRSAAFFCALPMLLAPGITQAASYAVSNIGKTEIVGDSAAVAAGGLTTNFSTGTVTVGSSFAKFQLRDATTNNRVADMKVTLSGVYGTLDTAGGRSGLMIAQTVNSQGLTDTGTMSVLTDFSAVGADGSAWIKLLFSFTAPDTNNPIAMAQEVTTFDFDYRQFLGLNKEDFIASGHGSVLTRHDLGSTVEFVDEGNSDATYNMSSNAVSLNNVVDSSYELTMGKKSGTGNALFMFEFRDPSINLDDPLTPLDVIPEPGTWLLTAFASLFLLRRKRTS
jgi:hypothetical protein